MARIIDLQFDDKTYSIEYDRRSVYRLMSETSEDKNQLDQVIDFVYFGLLKHHKDEMPTKEEITDWLIVIDDLQGFATELANCIQETITSIKEDKERGNVKWGVRK